MRTSWSFDTSVASLEKTSTPKRSALHHVFVCGRFRRCVRWRLAPLFLRRALDCWTNDLSVSLPLSGLIALRKIPQVVRKSWSPTFNLAVIAEYAIYRVHRPRPGQGLEFINSIAEHHQTNCACSCPCFLVFGGDVRRCGRSTFWPGKRYPTASIPSGLTPTPESSPHPRYVHC